MEKDSHHQFIVNGPVVAVGAVPNKFLDQGQRTRPQSVTFRASGPTVKIHIERYDGVVDKKAHYVFRTDEGKVRSDYSEPPVFLSSD